MLLRSLLVLAAACAALSSPAQLRVPVLDVPDPEPLPEFGPYRADVPVPAEFLGLPTGARVTPHSEGSRYIEAAVAAAPDRARLLTLGRSPGHRPLRLVVVSSPANIQRLDTLRAQLAELADPRRTLTPERVAELAAGTPVVVWLAYSVHGDETAGFDASLLVLHRLLASRAPAIESLLDKVIVVLSPCQNPDGHDRYATFANAHGLGREETFAHEKRTPWESLGRFNDRYFDMNRDLLALTQVETRLSAAAFLDWSPQVAADHHGETKEYFFPPAALPIHAALPRELTDSWQAIFGRANAAAFDRAGWLYYVRDIFDLFYPGYWDSWMSLQGAIGMTYETSGGGERGLRHRREDGTVVTLRGAIARHVTASFATLEASAAHREARLRDWRRFWELSFAAGRAEGAPWQYVLPPGRGEERRRELAALLRRHGIEVGITTAATEALVHGYAGGPPKNRTLPAGTLVVDLQQPRGLLARALLERQAELDPAFVQRQEERRTRNAALGSNVPGEEAEFYDITAWALPLAFEVEAWWTEGTTVGARVEPWRDTPPAVTAPARATVAYAWTPSEDAGLRLAFALLNEGYRVAATPVEMLAAGRTWPAGTLTARTSRNPDTLHGRIAELARTFGVDLVPVDTAWADSGETAPGSDAVFALEAPAVAVTVGDGVAPTFYGALRLLLERSGVDFVPVRIRDLGDIPADGFNVIILSDGSPGAYRRGLGDDGAARLRTWCEAGGVLIAIGGAAEWASDEDLDLTTSRPVEAKPEGAEDGDEARPLYVPGAFLRGSVDPRHFLGWSRAEPAVDILFEGDFALTASTTGSNAVRFPTAAEGGDLVVSGFTWSGDTERLLRGAALVVDEPLGEGRLLMFAQPPVVRGLVRTLERPLLNALLYGPAYDRAAGGY